MPRSLDFFVPCRSLDDAPKPAMDAHHPWRTPGGALITAEREPAVRSRTAQATPTRSRPAGSPARRGKRTGRRRSAFGVMRGLAVLVAAGAVGCLAAFPDVREAAAAALPGVTPQQAFGSDHVRILLLGADQDYDESGRRLKSGGRSDTLILADLDLARHTAHLCSIPRDTEARIPGHGFRRINSAYAYGGVELARRSVEDLTNLEVDHTVVVNLEGFEQAVDALGGVEVDVDKSLRYTDNWAHLNIDIPAGHQRLDGKRAMQFVRFRHDALADIGRARRQQEFMRALGQSMRRPGAVMAWPGVVRAVSRHTETDLTPAQMVALGRFAKDMQSMDTETLPGSFHRSRWRPDREGVRRMAARLSD